MGIAIINNLQSSHPSQYSHSHHHYYSSFLLSYTSSMSQDYHNQDTGEAAAAAGGGGGGGGGVGIFSFSSSDNNGFHPTPHHHHHHQQHMSHQIRRDKLRDQAEYHSTNPSSLVGIHDVHEEDSASLNHHHHHHHQVNETTGMLSEMFNFAPGGQVPTAVDLLEHQTSLPRQPIDSGDWYGGRQGMVIDGLGEADSKSHHNNQNRESSNYSQGQHHHTISGSINADAAAAMQLFLANPPPRSPSPSPHHHSSSTLHMLLPDPHQQTSVLHHAYAGGGGGGGDGGGGISPSQFSWIPGPTAPSEIGGMVEGQGLSLSLSSSLQHLEAAKAEELRIGDGGVFYYNQPGQAVAAAAQSSSSAAQYYRQQQQQVLHQQQQNHHHQVHVSGLGSGLGVMNVLRHSKYVKAAQELLEEFCSVGRGQFKKNKSLARLNSSNSNNGGGGSSEKDQLPLPPLSSSDRMEHQRRKVKLVSMLDEVDRRYNHYSEQMQMVVNSFDLVMGFGAAVPYTALAQKAMSRHFRCLKDAIAGQLKQSCEMLGEKESGGAGGSSAGITRGETPRLKALEQSLRQQRAFHQMGMMEQEAWRPQRGLPERSVNILRAWLFEHFLHPYPSDADKHLLARQTGLSRNQVSNWFINARVRLWKPMIEDMYQQEAKEAADDEDETSQDRDHHDQLHTNSQTQPPPPTIMNNNADMSSSAVGTTTQAEAAGIISGIGEENDPCSSSLIPINTHCFSENQASTTTTTTTTTNINTGGATMLSSAADVPFHDFADDTTCHRRSGASGIIAPDYGGTSVGNHHHHLHLHHVSVHDQSLIGPNTTTTTTTTTNTTAAPPLQIRYGTTAAAGGDVSLTLGLRHAGNMPENASSAFSIRDFGDC